MSFSRFPAFRLRSSRGWNSTRLRKRLYEKTPNRIAYYQRRNACARTSHTKATICKLHRRGIKLTGLPRCEENTS